MKRLPANAEGMDQALQILRDGGVVIHATETCYGLACDITNPNAVEKLFAIKDRPHEQPVSALFASVDAAKQYVRWNDRAERLAQKFLPGALTIILPLRADAPMRLYPAPQGGATVGIRVSSHDVADRLATAFGRPLTTTSANPHGEGNPYNPTDILSTFERARDVPDLLLDSGPLPQNPPSTVINLATGEGGIVRTGVVQPL